jgi:hypothetical protein
MVKGKTLQPLDEVNQYPSILVVHHHFSPSLFSVVGACSTCASGTPLSTVGT